MNAVEVFQFPATGQDIRTVLVDGEPWFVAADICIPLGFRDAANAVRSLQADERRYSETSTADGSRRMLLVNESGIYALIFRSRNEDAQRFRKWVTSEVLPTIRRTGRYEPVSAPSAQEVASAISKKELALMVVESEEARERAEARADRAEHGLAIATPKAEAFEAFMDADGTYSMEQVAKMLHGETGLGRNNLFKKLRELSILEDNNLPYQRYAHHFHVVASSFEHSDGRREMTYTTRVRATGVDYIRRRLNLHQAALVPLP